MEHIPTNEFDLTAVLFLLVLCAVGIGWVLGVVTSRPSLTQARVQHKALLLLQQANTDPIVGGLIHRQVNRLERRLHIWDDDQDD